MRAMRPAKWGTLPAAGITSCLYEASAATAAGAVCPALAGGRDGNLKILRQPVKRDSRQGLDVVAMRQRDPYI